MLETLISSRTRIKLLLKFFLNAQSKGYLRSLEQEFGESTNAIRLELNKFEEAGMLSSETEGNKKVYRANPKHPLFDNLHGLVMKYVGLDKIVDNITERLGKVEAVYLVGDYAEGRDSGIIDLFVLSSELNMDYLLTLLEKAEKQIERKIRYVHFKTRVEIEKLLDRQSHLLIWES
ncbi:helix-turn-helix domain-containing protein [Croceimicrobium hydrocarbonivorans]|uniref:ArsR family transcriptional regulator n=1 Tax=Croceimicrobium hydrocarbonivorans TaxID=2761580 RepID=A0A7H0VGC0_9FLAO|nr:ArsR family transcriptional regulator [Croceimicrobium hydrocarbonivorans]QNR24768.1 ArsR family transcriptional regulator [Croceimicrobium hydrocarbonivorans]